MSILDSKFYLATTCLLLLLFISANPAVAEDVSHQRLHDCPQYDAWYDEQTSLSWQDPQKDAYADNNGGVTSLDAIRYCEELIIKGQDDWRLPTIDELRSIIRGASGSESSGACPVTEGARLAGTSAADVVKCSGQLQPFQCSGSGNCCLHEALNGTCNTVDPASTTHYLETWSSTPAADDPENWIGYVFFDTGTVGFNHSLSLGEVRCVRDGPITDKTSATTDTDDNASHQCVNFIPSPGPVDVCAGGDTVKVTINVPEKLKKRPYMLAAFLYADGEINMRPPDVGIDDNDIRFPDIDADKPITMIIPGCSYYRDRRMTGDYYLSVYLKMDENKYPGPPGPDDMHWNGLGRDPITLTGDGTSHYEFDVTLTRMFRRR
jgi:hypothetical protein